MRLNKLTLALTLAMFALPLSAMAQDTSTGTDTTPAADAAATANDDATPPADAAATANDDATPPADAAANANTDATPPADASTNATPPADASTNAAPPADASTDATPAAEAPATDDNAAAAPAEAPASNLTWNLGVTSDYVFRGISQTDRDPALQGGFDYSFGDSGFYIGTWGSNVDFQDRDGPDVEIDFYGGFNHDFNDKWNGDISVIRYTYYGARNVYGSVDYNEYIGKLAWNKMLTLTVGYANDYANAGFSSLYTGLDGSWDVGNGFTFNAGVGHTNFSDNNGSYNDWLLGISREFGPVTATLNYFDTNVDGPRLSDSLVLTLKIGG